MIIALTDTLGSELKFRKYREWISRGIPEAECEVLSYKLGNLAAIERAHGVVLTGGHDVEPARYGGPVGHPSITEVDPRRDAFEFEVIDRTLKRGLPLLGICRGMQVANVYFGGTLIADIEEAGYPSHRSRKEYECRHGVVVEPGTRLRSIAGADRGEVNSSHHQAVLKPGKGLTVAAKSADGIIEALEGESGYRLFVQWHPERMADTTNPFSERVLKSFADAIHTT